MNPKMEILENSGSVRHETMEDAVKKELKKYHHIRQLKHGEVLEIEE